MNSDTALHSRPFLQWRAMDEVQEAVVASRWLVGRGSSGECTVAGATAEAGIAMVSTELSGHRD